MKCTCAAPFASALNYGVFRARLICLHSLSVPLNRRLLVEGVQTNQRCRNKTKSQRSGRAQFHTSFEKQIEWIFPDSLLDQGMLDLVKHSFPPPTLIYNQTHSWICAKPLIMLTRLKRGSKRTSEKERAPTPSNLWYSSCEFRSQKFPAFVREDLSTIYHMDLLWIYLPRQRSPCTRISFAFFCISQEAPMWWPHKSWVLLEHFY